jgi:predicted LPLAT superfamily acyltransferase
MNRPIAAGSGRHWAQINEFSFITGMRLLFWLARLFGRGPFRILLYPVLLWYLVAKPAARAASKNYLRRMASFNDTVGVESGIFGMLRHFAAFGESILDKMLLWSGFLDVDSVQIHGIDLVVGQFAERRGGIFICCHLGNLELCRVLAKRQPELKMTVLLYTKHAAKFNKLLAQLDPESRLNLMQVTELTPGIAALLAEKVAQGEFVAIAGDRIPVSANPRVAMVNFLGERAPFPIGPYVLASLFQCPVYLLFTMRGKNGSEVYFELFRESIQLPHRGRDDALAGLAASYAARLEFFCQRAPLQWFNFYDFWHLPKANGLYASRSS